MGLMERLSEVAQQLGDEELAEVVGFAEGLQARRHTPTLTAPTKHVDANLMRQVRGLCPPDLKWQREELYDRGLR